MEAEGVELGVQVGGWACGYLRQRSMDIWIALWICGYMDILYIAGKGKLHFARGCRWPNCFHVSHICESEFLVVVIIEHVRGMTMTKGAVLVDPDIQVNQAKSTRTNPTISEMK